MPSEEVVASWVHKAWYAIPDSVVKRSIQKAGFDADSQSWHISNHDVYGEIFNNAWKNRHVSNMSVELNDVKCLEVLDMLDE